MIKEVERSREQTERVQFKIPADLVPDRQTQYSQVGKMYRPESVSVVYRKRSNAEWHVHYVAVMGFRVLASGKPSVVSHVEKFYSVPSEKSWLTDLVRENMPQD